ncbi:MAG: response regulator [Lachnospiraceae bacterium]|nr:response regulator [Lachnospiraceae bacterium]
MITLRVLFIISTVLCLACFVVGVKNKRRNFGLLLMMFALMIANIAMAVVIGTRNVVVARKCLTVYYVCHAFFYFSAVLMVVQMSMVKKLYYTIIPTAFVTLYQLFIVIGNYYGTGTIRFSRHVAFGRTWWIASNSNLNKPFYGFGAYRGMSYLLALFLVILCIVGAIKSADLFRKRFYLVVFVEVSFALTHFAIQKNDWPVWMICLLMTPICVLYLYITTFYTVKKLRDSSLMRFADEMNDAFILYDEYDYLIYMNEVISEVLNEELLNAFKNKKNLDEWASTTMTIEGMDVLVLGTESGEIYYRARKMELIERGHFLGTIYILHNTTDTLMKLGAMKEANIELERAARMKSDFLANMSHEIRTPMNAVIGMAELSLREELPPDVVDYISQIKTSGKNLLNIINDILDFSKIEAGKMEILPDRYEPLSEINDIANILVNRIGDKKIELFVTSDVNVPHALLGDAMRIRQIIINLANNAIKFTNEGIVHIEVSCEQINAMEVNMTYHIIDTGMGIKEEDRSKLFKSFEQVNAQRNRSVEGTGLGLAISKSLCEAMGGEIGVESEYGVGSDFYFSIPQKIIDDTKELVVKDAENVVAYVYNENSAMAEMFIEDAKKLGISGKWIASPSEYEPTGKKDYIFFTLDKYNADIRNILENYEDLNGIVLVDYDSEFESDRPNLRVMRRPETTLNLVLMLNGAHAIHRQLDASKAYNLDFVAPEAKILIVDDNEINITIVEGLLQPSEIKCFHALSGKEAIEKIRTEDFDVVLMDHMMPEMDGIEATRIIRETIPKAFGLPILALTANVMEGVKDMFIHEGMNDFIPKPIDIRELANKLKYWLPKELIKERTKAVETAVDSPNKEALSKFLDCEKAVSSLGSYQMLEKVVKEYYKAGDGKRADLISCFEKEDFENYTIKIHALKSSSRQIGAYELGDISEKLEFAGKDGNYDFIRENHSKAIELYDELINELSDIFKEKEDSAKKEDIEKDMLDEALDKLYKACDDLDVDTMEEVRDYLIKYNLPESLEKRMQELSKAVDDIDTDACADIINEYRNAD